jgi:hypothetical protein
MQGDLCAAGFVINKEKSMWVPTQTIERLGIIWDAKSGLISIRQKRVDKTTLLYWRVRLEILANLPENCRA